MACRSCFRRWEPEGPEGEERCPHCGSSEVEETYKEIPGFDRDPGVGLVVAAESQIARTQDGAIMHREMVAWLRFHGVRSRAEMLQWEAWFIAIHGMRSRIMEELMDMPTKNRAADEQGD
jgi:hypothetical protein